MTTLTSQGHNKYSSLLFVDELTHGDVAPNLDKGWIRVRGHLGDGPVTHETLVTTSGTFSVRMKRIGRNRFRGHLDTNGSGWVDVPMWLAKRWGLCDQYGNLSVGGNPVICPTYGKLTKKAQATWSSPSVF